MVDVNVSTISTSFLFERTESPIYIGTSDIMYRDPLSSHDGEYDTSKNTSI